MDRNDHLFVDKLNSKNHIYQCAINTTYKKIEEKKYRNQNPSIIN